MTSSCGSVVPAGIEYGPKPRSAEPSDRDFAAPEAAEQPDDDIPF